jgi:hypothetical protein
MDLATNIQRKETLTMAEMLFTFAAIATNMKGGLTSLDGMKRLSDVLHPCGVKITWLVSLDSGAAMKDQIDEWHEIHGDDIAISVPGFTGSHEEIVAQLKQLRADAKKVFPWTEADIAGGCHQSTNVLPCLEDAGFVGTWGFCWEQIEVDGITDRGCPWGFYYLDPKQRTAPNPDTRGVIGMEWTARDLLKAFHSGNPCIYSTDVNDVARGGICSWDNIEYLESMFDNYYANLRFNDLVVYQVHQEAHEMMPEFQCYSEEDIREAEIMLESLSDYVMAHESVRAVTLSEAAEIYREKNERTEPSHMLWEDTETEPYNMDYSRGTPRGPWPKSYLYYDTECQMMFIDGKYEPVCIRNYGNGEMNTYYAETVIPRVRLRNHARTSYGMDLDFTIESPKDMPFGVTFWEDFGPYLVDDDAGAITTKIISQELFFLRYDVKKGSTDYHVHLRRK